jgi:hypothetical protein
LVSLIVLHSLVATGIVADGMPRPCGSRAGLIFFLLPSRSARSRMEKEYSFRKEKKKNLFARSLAGCAS